VWIKDVVVSQTYALPLDYANDPSGILLLARKTESSKIQGEMPAANSIVGNKVAPGVLDLYLGKKGYDGQQTSEPQDANAPNNLWEPLPGDHGAHGRFGAESLNSSPELWLAKNRGWLMAAGLATAGIVLALSQNGSREPE
jgi:hypothetical protein